jgi:circadian clock protein KaiC
MTSTRVSTGDSQLDSILDGGLPADGLYVIAGLPGTGKTMLAEQILFKNATEQRRGLFIATLSEPLDKTLRFGEELEFFDTSAIGGRIVYESVADLPAVSGLQAAMERILVLLDRHQPSFLVLDSLRALRPFAQDERDYRRFIAELGARFAVRPITALFVGDYDVDDQADEPAFAVADGIIFLRSSNAGSRSLRVLQVSKLRGSDFRSGEHAYRLGSNGLTAYPRLADAADVSHAEDDDRRISLGSPGLDDMIGGGVFPGTTSLVLGPSGSGKTMLGLDFLYAAARRKEHAVFATLQESRVQLRRALTPRRRAEERVHVLHHSPVDVYVDQWIHEVLLEVTRWKATALFIDSLSDLRLATADPARFEEYLYSLVQRLSRLGITTLMTFENLELAGPPLTLGTTVSHLSDNIIALGYAVEQGRMRRVIAILKSRASGHDTAVRLLEIGSSGLRVGPAADEELADAVTQAVEAPGGSSDRS